MDRIPVETWLQICAEACTDGGTTGRSLALVSRYVRELSKPYRLQSISLRGHKQAISCALMLHCTPIEEQLIVDLHVQFDGDATQPKPGTLQKVKARMKSFVNADVRGNREQYDARFWLRGGWRSRRTQGNWRNAQFRQELSNAVHSILELLKLHPRRPLRTLTLNRGIRMAIPYVAWCAPRYGLETLTSLIIKDLLDGVVFHYIVHTHVLPNLQYLDITGVVFDYWHTFSMKLVANITLLAPALAYLRLTVQTAMFEELPPMQWLCDDVHALASAGGSRDPLPCTMRMVFFQQDFDDISKRGEYAEFMRSLKDLEERDHRFESVDWREHCLSLQELIMKPR